MKKYATNMIAPFVSNSETKRKIFSPFLSIMSWRCKRDATGDIRAKLTMLRPNGLDCKHVCIILVNNLLFEFDHLCFPISMHSKEMMLFSFMVIRYKI